MQYHKEIILVHPLSIYFLWSEISRSNYGFGPDSYQLIFAHFKFTWKILRNSRFSLCLFRKSFSIIPTHILLWLYRKTSHHTTITNRNPELDLAARGHIIDHQPASQPAYISRHRFDSAGPLEPFHSFQHSSPEWPWRAVPENYTRKPQTLWGHDDDTICAMTTRQKPRR